MTNTQMQALPELIGVTCKHCHAPVFRGEDYYKMGARYVLTGELVWRHLETGRVRCGNYPHETAAEVEGSEANSEAGSAAKATERNGSAR